MEKMAMKIKSWFREKLESYKDDFEFRLESLILNLTENICIKMKQKNVNRTELADLLNVSPPAVTKILNGNSNFTLKTLLSLADALEQNLEINFVEKEAAYISVADFGEFYKPTCAYFDEDDIQNDVFALTSSDSIDSGFHIQKERRYEAAA